MNVRAMLLHVAREETVFPNKNLQIIPITVVDIRYYQNEKRNSIGKWTGKKKKNYIPRSPNVRKINFSGYFNFLGTFFQFSRCKKFSWEDTNTTKKNGRFAGVNCYSHMLHMKIGLKFCVRNIKTSVIYAFLNNYWKARATSFVWSVTYSDITVQCCCCCS